MWTDLRTNNSEFKNRRTFISPYRVRRMMQSDDGLGIGVDITELKRFRVIADESSFYTRIYTRRELEYCRAFSDPIPHLAATFAAKEAVLKAIGIRHGESLNKIEILHDESGAPHVERPFATHRVIVSLSHTDNYAAAVALAIPAGNSLDDEYVRKLLNGMATELSTRSADADEQF